MANTLTEFNLTDGQEAERKLLKTFVNVATASETEEWELIGEGIEESAIEYNTDTTTSTDILGKTRTKVNKTEPAQSFEPYTVRGGSKLAFILWDIYRRNAVSELTQFKVLVVHEFVGSSAGFAAETQDNCTITVTSIGGSAYVDMPISISYSNKKTLGKVTYTGETPTFTADSGL
jgi:hypothetical protein